MNDILLNPVFGTYSYILYFVIYLYFSNFSTTCQNLEFHIYRSHMETGLSEEINFCTRKKMKKPHFMSPYKMINLFQDVVANFFQKKCELWVEMSSRIRKTKFQSTPQLF